MHRIGENFEKKHIDISKQPHYISFENFPSGKIPMFIKKTRNLITNTPKNSLKHRSLKYPHSKMHQNLNEKLSIPSSTATNRFIPVLKASPNYLSAHKRNQSLNFALNSIQKQEKVSYINIEPIALTENTLTQVMSANNSTRNNSKIRENKYLHRYFRHQSAAKSKSEVKSENTKEKLETSKESDNEVTNSILRDCENTAYHLNFDSWDDESPEKECYNVLKPRFQL